MLSMLVCQVNLVGGELMLKAHTPSRCREPHALVDPLTETMNLYFNVIGCEVTLRLGLDRNAQESRAGQ
jgi:hypothetical protein